MNLGDLKDRNQARLATAQACIAGANLAAANVLCWNVLDHDRKDPVAWHLLGTVAAKLQIWDKAAEFFGIASELGIAEANASRQQALTASAAAPAATAAQGERYLLIKSWGAGFWSDVSHVLGGLILAEITGRTPVVHWGPNSRFTDGSGRDVFTRFFEPVSERTILDLSQFDQSEYFPPKWHGGNLLEEENAKWTGAGAQLDAIYLLNRPEKVIVADFYISIANFAPLIPRRHPLAALSIPDLYRHAIQSYFRPRAAILDRAKIFFAENLSGAPYLAVHMRGSDKVKECTFTSDGEEFLAYITGETFKILDQTNPSLRIFLMTDDDRIARRTVARYGKRIVMTKSQRSVDERGPHFIDTMDRPGLAAEVMTDVFLALQAGAFIGFGGSNVAAMVALLRNWPEKQCILIGPNMLLRRAPMPYLSEAYRDLETPDWE